VQTVRIVRAPKRPSADERANNPRASSARLRVAEKLDTRADTAAGDRVGR
jgi:16S rRNA C1402 N4-methylase RsmH